MTTRAAGTVAELRDARLRFGDRTIWDGLSLAVQPGEFIAVLGPNGAGKTSLIRVLLGLQRLDAGEVTVNGRSPRRGSADIGYIPQHKGFDRDLPLRGRDLVRMGLDGHRFGLPMPSHPAREQVQRVIDAVGAASYADAPLGALSGGEQQRLRIAQALLSDPTLLLCDEPLLSLDLNHQRGVMELIDGHRRRHDSAVILVTHEINPVLPYVDRVLYLVGGRWAVGTPDEVLTSERLTDLFSSPVDVLRLGERIVVVGGSAQLDTEPSGHGHHHSDDDWRRS